MSLYILTSWGMIPIGNVLAGAIAERSTPTVALVAGSAVTLVAAVVVAAAVPAVRRLEARAAAAGPVARAG
jgi:hypothetical protein